MKTPNLLKQNILYSQTDLMTWSPISSKFVATGMTVSQLCAAAITVSDNTAMNLLAKRIGGIQTINSFARSINDHDFRLDHQWPDEAHVRWGKIIYKILLLLRQWKKVCKK